MMAEEKLASRWLVSTEWLAPRLSDPNVIVLDASYYLANHKRDAGAEFLAGHIPSAQRFDIDAISDKSNPLPHMLPSPEQFASQVGALGIGDGMTVVLYDGIGLYGAARVWWTFPCVRLRQCSRARWGHAEVEGRKPAARDRTCQAPRSKDLHAEIQSQSRRLDRRRAKGAARQDCAGRRPRARPTASAARRRSRARVCAAATCRARSMSHMTTC
jgi:thiosulfate/3-mercaptopyruvate sulfurtransferase